jgi:hypothetical protein
LVIATIMSFHFASNLLIRGIDLTSGLEFAGSLAIFISAIFLLKDFRKKQLSGIRSPRDGTQRTTGIAGRCE